MAAVTLTTLRARARERADMTGSSFVTDAANSLDAFINEGVQELHELLALKWGDRYRVSSSVLTTIANTSSYALPADFFHLLGVDLVVDGKTLSLEPFIFQERNALKNSSLVITGHPLPRYALEGDNLRLYPAPTSVRTGTIWYVPTSALLVAGIDTVNFPNGFERYIVLYAAIACLKKEESDASSLEAELLRLREKLDQAAEHRDANAPQSAVDIDLLDDVDLWGIA